MRAPVFWTLPDVVLNEGPSGSRYNKAHSTRGSFFWGGGGPKLEEQLFL